MVRLPRPLSDTALLASLIALSAGAAVINVSDFVPSSTTVAWAIALAGICTVLVVIWVSQFDSWSRYAPFTRSANRIRPLRLWERFGSLAVFGGMTFMLTGALFGNVLPWLVTAAIGAPGAMIVQTDEPSERFIRNPSCIDLRLLGVPDRMIGSKVMCGDKYQVIRSGTRLHLSGRRSALGIQVSNIEFGPDS
jgi:hypothetical protein